jgi:hypothetical protein
MKGIGILILLLILGGCIAAPSLEELEDQALLTGDWSQVEKRERLIERRRAREQDLPDCEPGSVRFCERQIGQDRCGCMSRSSMRDVFSGF